MKMLPASLLASPFLNNLRKKKHQFLKSNQGNQGYSGNQKNVLEGQRPDMENRHTQQRI